MKGPDEHPQPHRRGEEEGLADEGLQRMYVVGIDLGRLVGLVVDRVDADEVGDALFVRC
jgi:hypothetical protein